MFKPVPSKIDHPSLEEQILTKWDEDGTVENYLTRNDNAREQFSFLDGPITANNPMGVHHAWGRTYKDLFQRFNTMKGYEQRYQNGFDCQGLWVEVEVEKELGLNSKREIEEYGIAEFVKKCRERVLKYARIQTEQSKRLGYWMDWENSYYTMSEENNYTIWHFLKTVHDRGFIYRGHDVMPWCTRCGTGLSEHEIVTEGYKEVTHRSIYVRLPLRDGTDRNILVWTTTPWTLPANVAVAVNPEEIYVELAHDGERYILAKEAADRIFGPEPKICKTFPGSALLGKNYEAPLPDLPAQQDVTPVVISWEDVDPEEGSGCVHIAPGCGQEDFALGQEFDLPALAPLDEFGVFGDEYGFLSKIEAHSSGPPIISALKERGKLLGEEDITHRYPVCWRCNEELVFRLVDEWFIAMDPWRQEIMDVVKQIDWIPEFGEERELDWLRNMSDWMISKKRYWGLALPIWVCSEEECGHFDVIGSREELRDRAVEGWEELSSHTPHKPWIDRVKLECPECSGIMQRIPDVGNPWLDAGIVAYSTLHYLTDQSYWEKWFPADFITESFPGQFRNWFYSLLAMSTALERRPPFRTVLGHGLVLDENGEEMHKSAGNAIWFEDATDEIGADVMRWLYVTSNPIGNVLFGYGTAEEIRRRFFIPLWNIYSFFITYARIDEFEPGGEVIPVEQRPSLDRWIYGRMHDMITEVDSDLGQYRPARATQHIERFVEDLSNWYVRRSRRRFWRKGRASNAETQTDKRAAYCTLYYALVNLTKVLAPFVPHLTEYMYHNLVVEGHPLGNEMPGSVHLTDYPDAQSEWLDEDLLSDMDKVRQIASLGRAARDGSGIKVRQPLSRVMVVGPEWNDELDHLIRDELNVKEVERVTDDRDFIEYEIGPDYAKLGPKYTDDMPEIVRAIQECEPRATAEAIRGGEEIQVGRFTLLPDELTVRTKNREGVAAATEGDYTVALSTDITPELRSEGRARDLIRLIQQSRKQAEFDVSDRICIRYTADEEIQETFERFHSEICEEVLAESLEKGDPGKMEHRVTMEVDECEVQIGLTRKR